MSKNEKSLNWSNWALRIGKCFPLEQLHPDTLVWLQRPETKSVLVACSGGPDSVAVLCALWAHAKKLHIKLIVGHYNHRWRASKSDEDAHFVATMADDLGCEFIGGVRPEDQPACTETSARVLRMEFLRTEARLHNCQCIIFGHQLDDILELQLQRLVRGVGSEGLAAPRAVHIFTVGPAHLRPLLNLRAALIRDSLNAIDVPTCEDATNLDTTIARNGLRHTIIPQLSQTVDRDASVGAARSRQLLEEESSALDTLAREQFATAYSGADYLDRVGLRSAPRALTRRALVAWLASHDLVECLSASGLEQLLDVVVSSKTKHSMSAGCAFIKISAEQIRIASALVCDSTNPIKNSALTAEDSVHLPNRARLSRSAVIVDSQLRDLIFSGAIDPNCEAYLALDHDTSLQVRGWLPGDRFTPIGAPGSKKLKDWFIDRQIPKMERNQLPVVTIAHKGIVWVPGLPPAEESRITIQTIQALRLTYHTSDPI
ncbi:MAG: tRNA lysidine(34) synthetase TilS [Puniceicoccaceae bacterium MED-G31]|nr:MAG: tRNA lysidine(34) synthetase TilS [Puniceicoccaceae bacterium MED-G31]